MQDKAEYSAFEPTLNPSIVSYRKNRRIIFPMLIRWKIIHSLLWERNLIYFIHSNKYWKSSHVLTFTDKSLHSIYRSYYDNIIIQISQQKSSS